MTASGKQPGPGRKSGSAWAGKGKTHRQHVRRFITLTPEHDTWINMQPGKRSKIIRRLIQDAISKEEQHVST